MITKISDLTNKYNQVENEIKETKNKIEELKNYLTKLNNHHHWVDSIIEPLAKEIAKKLDLPVWKIDADLKETIFITIYFARNKKSLSTQKVKSIMLYPEDNPDGFKLYVNYKIDVNNFSIQEIIRYVN